MSFLSDNAVIIVILLNLLNFIFRCVCASGQLSNDGKHCHESSAFLVYAIQSQLRFLYLDPKKKTAPHPPISGPLAHAAVALDFDYEEKLIFFTVLKKSIFSVYLNGTGLKEMNLTGLHNTVSPNRART